MGLLTSQTRAELKKWEAGGDSFADFLNDVAEQGFERACEDRHLAQGALARWIGENEGRAEAYSVALRVRAELLVHEGMEIVDDEDIEVARAKLRSAYRLTVAGHWSDRYRPRVKIENTSAPVPDAGLIGFASDLLRLVASRPQERLIAPQGPDAGELARSDESLALPVPAGNAVPAGWL